MKTLIVYYSRSGNTRGATNLISDPLDCDVEELIDTKSRSGPLGFIRAGRDATGRKLTTLEAIKNDPSEYDLVVIGTPLWGGNMTPAVRTYITENSDKFKKVAFFSTAGSSDSTKLFNEMEEIINQTPIATLSIIGAEVKSGEYKTKIEKFVNEIKG